MGRVAKDDLTKDRSRLAILSELLTYPSVRAKDWTSDISHVSARKGDLVSMNSAPASKWYLSWVVDYRERSKGWPEWLLESVEDGSLCWWSNVGLNIYSRERVSNCWRWTDRQWKFKDRWMRHCVRKHDAYIVLPCWPEFDNRKVTLSLRIRHGLGEGFQHQQEFEDFRKVTTAIMSEFYLSGVEKHNSRKAA